MRYIYCGLRIADLKAGGFEQVELIHGVEDEVMNTKFSYLYRDGCNYKTFNEVIIAGRLRADQIIPLLKDEDFFIPSEIGLPDLQEMPLTADDHIWHEIEYIESTDQPPTVALNAAVLMDRIKTASGNNWNEDQVFINKGMI